MVSYSCSFSSKKARILSLYQKQIFDLGLQKGHLDPGTVKEHLNTLAEDFDLVLVTEKMDESLVLLAKELCLPLQYVSYTWKNKRREDFQVRISDHVVS